MFCREPKFTKELHNGVAVVALQDYNAILGRSATGA